MISVYATTCDSDDNQKYDLCNNLTTIAGTLGEKEIVVTAEDFNGDIGSNAEDYEDQHGGYGHGMELRTKEKDSKILCSYDII